MSDITGSPSSAPPLEPHKAGWWRDRMTDLGFWGVVVILYLVGVVILSAFTGTSGATGTFILTLLIAGVAALGGIFAFAVIRRAAERKRGQAEEERAEQGEHRSEPDEREGERHSEGREHAATAR